MVNFNIIQNLVSSEEGIRTAIFSMPTNEIEETIERANVKLKDLETRGMYYSYDWALVHSWQSIASKELVRRKGDFKFRHVR